MRLSYFSSALVVVLFPVLAVSQYMPSQAEIQRTYDLLEQKLPEENRDQSLGDNLRDRAYRAKH